MIIEQNKVMKELSFSKSLFVNVLAKSKLLAITLGLDKELVKRICYILKQIRSLKPVVSLEGFEIYCTET